MTLKATEAEREALRRVGFVDLTLPTPQRVLAELRRARRQGIDHGRKLQRKTSTRDRVVKRPRRRTRSQPRCPLHPNADIHYRNPKTKTGDRKLVCARCGRGVTRRRR